MLFPESGGKFLMWYKTHSMLRSNEKIHGQEAAKFLKKKGQGALKHTQQSKRQEAWSYCVPES